MIKAMTAIIGLAMLAASSAGAQEAQRKGAPELTNYGRASIKIVGADGFVLYVDPYIGDYSEPADLILVTHGHGDHNAVGKVAKKPGCKVAGPAGSVSGALDIVVAEGAEFEVGGVTVKAVPASNKNHKRGDTVGYLIGMGGLAIYHAGDTSKLPEMAALAKSGVDWALLPCDGFYNMGPEEAAECAKLVGAKRAIPIHSSPKDLFLKDNAERFASLVPGAVVVQVGKSVVLAP